MLMIPPNSRATTYRSFGDSRLARTYRGRRGGPSFPVIAVCLAAVLLAVALLSGCVDQSAKDSLSSAYTALDSRNYDAVAAYADAALARSPSGPAAAEALYLKGRAFEQRPKLTDADTQRDLTAALSCYNQALANQPPHGLEAYIRCGAANVDYWQQDYSAAASQWTTAYNLLDDSDTDVKSMTLYRIGLCRQRLGDFVAADAMFSQVESLYPDSEAARRSVEHAGARAFWLQLATFANTQNADAVAMNLRRTGIVVMRTADARGRPVVSAGPFATFATASAMKSRVAPQYPDAIILP
jgi:tetratricopeptide (TPR) repeat protein